MKLWLIEFDLWPNRLNPNQFDLGLVEWRIRRKLPRWEDMIGPPTAPPQPIHQLSALDLMFDCRKRACLLLQRTVVSFCSFVDTLWSLFCACVHAWHSTLLSSHLSSFSLMNMEEMTDRAYPCRSPAEGGGAAAAAATDPPAVNSPRRHVHHQTLLQAEHMLQLPRPKRFLLPQHAANLFLQQHMNRLKGCINLCFASNCCKFTRKQTETFWWLMRYIYSWLSRRWDVYKRFSSMFDY